ncbi:MAG: VOC family protein [Streptosporangiales bacterium]|nr:VOC family protein [Streptosporangiales bacterium]
MQAVRLQVTSVTIGAPDPRELARFYARLLDTELSASDPPRPGEPAEAGWAQLRSTSDHGRITLNFEYERHYSAPRWPSEPGRQHSTQHLDIYVEDLESATAWAVSCGATLADIQPQSDVRVLYDPAGHPFCLFT